MQLLWFILKVCGGYYYSNLIVVLDIICSTHAETAAGSRSHQVATTRFPSAAQKHHVQSLTEQRKVTKAAFVGSLWLQHPWHLFHIPPRISKGTPAWKNQRSTNRKKSTDWECLALHLFLSGICSPDSQAHTRSKLLLSNLNCSGCWCQSTKPLSLFSSHGWSEWIWKKKLPRDSGVATQNAPTPFSNMY